MEGRLQVIRTPDQVATHRADMAIERQIARAREHASRQKAEKLKRVAGWSDRRKILHFYRLAQRLSMETGVEHEVDHILPLQGRLVSGLHVETNLRVILKTENRQKSNHFEPD